MATDGGADPIGNGEVCLHVCVTCRAAGASLDSPERPGARLLRALGEALGQDTQGAAGIRIEPVECLSVCKRPCTIAVSSPGRWTYIYGDFDPDSSAETILAGLRLYAQTPDGLVPWRQRPEPFRKNVVARLPPVPPLPFKDAAE
jgi:predicted metal-binding protein